VITTIIKRRGPSTTGDTCFSNCSLDQTICLCSDANHLIAPSVLVQTCIIFLRRSTSTCCSAVQWFLLLGGLRSCYSATLPVGGRMERRRPTEIRRERGPRHLPYTTEVSREGAVVIRIIHMSFGELLQ
jgi:hypothetical protein